MEEIKDHSGREIKDHKVGKRARSKGWERSKITRLEEIKDHRAGSDQSSQGWEEINDHSNEEIKPYCEMGRSKSQLDRGWGNHISLRSMRKNK